MNSGRAESAAAHLLLFDGLNCYWLRLDPSAVFSEFADSSKAKAILNLDEAMSKWKLNNSANY